MVCGKVIYNGQETTPVCLTDSRNPDTSLFGCDSKGCFYFILFVIISVTTKKP